MALHGKGSYFSLDDSTGTPRNISPYVTQVTFSQTNDTHDTTTFGQNGHTFIAGLTNGKCTVTGLWDKTALVGTNTVFQSLVGLNATTMTFSYGPEGNTTGKVNKTGECILESYEESDPVADLVKFTAVLQITGSVTATVF